MTNAAPAAAADYKRNPFTLVYDGAITKNEPGKVNIHPVTYKLNGLDIVANVYSPANYDPSQKYPTIVKAARCVNAAFSKKYEPPRDVRVAVARTRPSAKA